MVSKSQEMRYRRKKIVLQLTAGGLICLLLLNFDWWAVFYEDGYHQQNEGVHRQVLVEGKSNNLLREMMGGLLHSKDDSPVCAIPHFKNVKSQDASKDQVCQRKKPSSTSCQLAREIFGDPQNKPLHTVCDHQTKQEFCKIIQTKSGVYKAVCDITTCQDGIYLGTVDMKTAAEVWKNISNVIVLEKAIEKLLQQEHTGFCLLRCGGDDQLGDPKFVPSVMDIDHLDPVSQILILPPFVKSETIDTHGNFINFNFVFIDSVSRSHFFRSLPKSVKAIENIALESKSQPNNPVVLDFQLVQAVRSRTYESLQTLFSGNINPFEKPFGVQSMPRSRLKVRELIKPLKAAGYMTQWVEDLCPLWEWGIAKDFLVYNKTLSVASMWNKLLRTVSKMKIDSIGPTLSSCRILHRNGHPDPFHGPDKICYNGQQQYDYILQYLYYYHNSMHRQNQPYFTFYESNIAHESSGLRVQYFDDSFSKYLKYISSLDNTLTVLFSDHGNSYGDFVSRSSEGRTEMYNPFLFMIIPPGVQTFLGNKNLNVLVGNQHKLISLLDVHYTFKYIIETAHKSVMKSTSDSFGSKVSGFNQQFNVSRYGLLSPISESRTCSDIPRIMPNLCICDGYDSASKNIDLDIIFALFALGQINNEIQRQRRKHLGLNRTVYGGFGRCSRLTADEISNIQKSAKGDKVTLKMDLYVTTPKQKFPEIIFIAITMDTIENKLISFNLENFDRITQYSIYSVCADPGVDLSLCICELDLGQGDVSTLSYNKPAKLNNMFDNKLRLSYDNVKVNGVECVKVIQRSGLHGVVADGYNNCDEIVTVYLEIAPHNLVLSPLNEVVLYPGDKTFLVAGVVMDTGKAWDWDMEINVLTSTDSFLTTPDRELLSRERKR